jgi:hypothetical protein
MDKKTTSSRKYNVQLITDGERWPFVGRAYLLNALQRNDERIDGSLDESNASR